jgi:folate-binding protein YgfZ
LTPQGKIVADFFVAEAPQAEGGGFFLDIPRALAITLVEKLNLYKLRAKLLIEDLSDILGVVAVWDGDASTKDCATKQGLTYADPRLPALGFRVMIPPHRAAAAASELGAALVSAEDFEAHRIALGVPRGGLDFAYGDAFPHEADMDQLGGVDFAKGCFIGQEVVSRIEHRGTARTRAVALRYEGATPESGAPITAGERQIGTMGSAARGRGIALVRLDRVAEAEQAALAAGGIPIRLIKPDWARFSFPSPIKAAE